MAELRLAVIDVKPGAAMESQSGMQMLRPRIYGAYAEPAAKSVAAIVMHPTSNFMGHYLIQPLAERGVCCLGLNSRYAGNDSVLLMERVIQDLGAGVKFLRGLGYRHVVLIGNSGGAALASFYQAQAEALSAETFVDGDPTHLVADDLPASRRSRAVRRARGPLAVVRALDRSVGVRRKRCTVGRSRARHVRAGERAPVCAGVPRPLRGRPARAPRTHRGVGVGPAAAAPHDERRAARPGLRRAPHARRPALPRSLARRQRSSAREVSGATRAR